MACVPRRHGATLVEILACLAIIATVLALVLPAVAAVRESGRVTSCRNNARQIGTALHACAARTGRLPLNQPVPWTVDAVRLLDPSLLPPLSALDRHVAWDQISAARLPVATFLCPSAPAVPHEERAIANHGLNARLPGLRLAAITDGLSHTLLTSEMPSDMAAPWAWGPLADEVNMGSAHRGRITAVFADGSTRSLTLEGDPGVVCGLLNPADGVTAVTAAGGGQVVRVGD